MASLDFVKAYRQYMTELSDSQGFFVSPTGGVPVVTFGITRVDDSSSVHFKEAALASEFAVEEHNKAIDLRNQQGSSPLKFQKIVNLNVEPTPATGYYITMEAEKSSGETKPYEAMVLKKRSGGYRTRIFRPAPYGIKSSDEDDNKGCLIGVNNLEPWMNESYLYYKFLHVKRSQVLGVEIKDDKESGVRKGYLRFKSCEDANKVLNQYVGRLNMACTNKPYDLDFSTCPTH